MKTKLLTIILVSVIPMMGFAASEDHITSPTEGVITTDYLGETTLKANSLNMLAKFMTYVKSIYTYASTNSEGTACGYFKAKSAGQNNEDGVRTNADLSMICAFVYKYAQAAN